MGLKLYLQGYARNNSSLGTRHQDKIATPSRLNERKVCRDIILSIFFSEKKRGGGVLKFRFSKKKSVFLKCFFSKKVKNFYNLV